MKTITVGEVTFFCGDDSIVTHMNHGGHRVRFLRSEDVFANDSIAHCPIFVAHKEGDVYLSEKAQTGLFLEVLKNPVRPETVKQELRDRLIEEFRRMFEHTILQVYATDRELLSQTDEGVVLAAVHSSINSEVPYSTIFRDYLKIDTFEILKEIDTRVRRTLSDPRAGLRSV